VKTTATPNKTPNRKRHDAREANNHHNPKHPNVTPPNENKIIFLTWICWIGQSRTAKCATPPTSKIHPAGHHRTAAFPVPVISRPSKSVIMPPTCPRYPHLPSP
jgi:hypothetical protein